MEKLGFLKYKVGMRILFTAFLILFFATTHSVVEGPRSIAENMQTTAGNQGSEQQHMYPIVTSKTHHNDCIQSGAGHSASSCSMDSKSMSSIFGSQKPISQKIKWYLQIEQISQEYSDHLLRPPIV